MPGPNKPGNAFLMNIVYKRERQSSRQDKTFDHFYEQCQRRISCRENLGQTECIYIVPPFATGMPIFNPQEITRKLFKKFKRDEFYVKMLETNIVYINWSQAGLEEAERQRRKKEATKSKDNVDKAKKETKRLKKKWGL